MGIASLARELRSSFMACQPRPQLARHEEVCTLNNYLHSMSRQAYVGEVVCMCVECIMLCGRMCVGCGASTWDVCVVYKHMCSVSTGTQTLAL